MDESLARLREMAAQAVDPSVTSSVVVSAFWEKAGGAIDPQAAYEAVRDRVQEVRKGGLSGAEATLVGQATALNAIFTEMARRGQAALDRPGIAAERYLRLAMRAQAQCRATLNALSAMAGRSTKAMEEDEPIRRIERVIIRPWHEIGSEEREERYGEGLDGGAARGLFAEHDGAEGVGAFDRTAYG
jgi:hypothetical protein